MSAGYLFPAVLIHLPLLAVLIVGLVLVAQRRARIGARSALLAQLGLSALILDTIAQAGWSVALPQLYDSFASSAMSLAPLIGLVGLVLTLLLTLGVALLIAAVATRTGPAESFAGMPTYAAAGQAYQPQTPAQPDP